MRRSRSILALALAGSLVLAACGDDEDNSAPATEAPAESEAPAGEEAAELVDIVDTAVAAGSFTTLAQLLTDAGLVETLKGEGPFTVFAPTDEAFAKVPAAPRASPAAAANPLVHVLTYPVVSGSVPSSAVTPGAVATVAGPDINITVDGSTVMVNDATVTAVDVMASNGVIHVIDTVLLPPQ